MQQQQSAAFILPRAWSPPPGPRRAPNISRCTASASTQPGSKPRVVSGARPIVGHLPEFLSDRDALLERGRREVGSVFMLNLAFNRMAVVPATRENSERFFAETDKALDFSEVYAPISNALGEVSLGLPHRDWLNLKPVLEAAFGGDSMALYYNAIYNEVNNFVQSLEDESGVIPHLHDAATKLARNVLGHAFFGSDFRAEVPDLWSAYDAAVASIDFALPSWLPLPKYNRGRQARKVINALMKSMMDRRRAAPEREYKDVLANVVLRVKRSDGTFLPDSQVSGIMCGLVLAGHETVAYQAAWTLIHLAQNKEFMTEVQHQVDEVLADAKQLDSPSTLRRMEKVFWAVDETTRLTPTFDFIPRVAVKPVNFDGVQISPGTRVSLDVKPGQCSDKVFSDPLVYDPYRFSAERREGGPSGGSAIVSFGGGGHPCLGRNVARTEMGMLVAMLLHKYDVEIKPQEPEKLTGILTPLITPTELHYRRRD